MIKKIVIKLLLILCMVNSHAQINNIYFNNIYEINGWWDGAGSILQKDTSYYLLSNTWYSSSQNYFKIGLSKLNLIGNILWNESYGDDSSYYSISKIHGNSFGFIINGLESHYTGHYKKYMLSLDYNGDTISNKTYDWTDPSYNSYSRETHFRNNSLFTVGADTKYDSSDLFIMKTDLAGNIITEDYLSFPNTFENVTGFSFTSDNNILIWGDQSQTQIDAFVVKADTTGNVIWWKKLGHLSYSDHPAKAVEWFDSTYFIGYNKVDSIQTSPFDEFYRFHLVHLDYNGNVISDTALGGYFKNYSTEKLIITPDSNLVTIGTIFPKGYIRKISPQGEIIFERALSFYDENLVGGCLACDEYLYDIINTSDGGFAAAGFITVAPPATGTQDSWAIKLNCLGYGKPPQPILFSDHQSAATITFNDSSKYYDEVWIDYGDGSNAEQISLTGSLTHTYATTDTFIVTLTATACGDTVIITDTVQTYFNPDGINENVSDIGISIYPNPVNDKLTITFTEHENAVIKIFSAEGKLLQQRTSTSKNEVFQLSEFSAGIYIVNIQSNRINWRSKIVK